MAKIDNLRRVYHERICAEVIFEKTGGIPSMADVDNKLSRRISQNILKLLPYPISKKEISGQTAGERLGQITRSFLEDSFSYLQHIRPGRWRVSVHDKVSDFDQYKHLGELAKIVDENKLLKTTLGDYVISPDVIIARHPLSDDEIN
jgi:hypothetical protein